MRSDVFTPAAQNCARFASSKVAFWGHARHFNTVLGEMSRAGHCRSQHRSAHNRERLDANLGETAGALRLMRLVITYLPLHQLLTISRPNFPQIHVQHQNVIDIYHGWRHFVLMGAVSPVNPALGVVLVSISRVHLRGRGTQKQT